MDHAHASVVFEEHHGSTDAVALLYYIFEGRTAICTDQEGYLLRVGGVYLVSLHPSQE